MDRSWMYGKRDSNFVRELEKFISFADLHEKKKEGWDGRFTCPCSKCMNRRIVCHGFKPDYAVWIWHGETMYGSSKRKREAEEITLDTSNEEINEWGEGGYHDEYDDEECDVELDRVEELIHDLQNESAIFEKLTSDSKKPLYPGCTKFSRLSFVLKLYSLKAKSGWSDVSFNSLLELLREVLPEGSEIPSTTYRCKKVLCPLRMSYQKIHACPNDCILYRKDYSELEACPRCGVSRYKVKDNDKKGGPAKVLWYLPIIPRFKRLFANPKDARYLRWHADGRDKNSKLIKHVADAPQWRNFDRKHEWFAEDPRFLRLGLCTDGINPYGTLNSQYSCWPVLLVIYNLPPHLCMKSKYIQLAMLISGPRQPGNDIDVYLEPLFDDLKLLWDDGVPVFDACEGKTFRMHAMLYCTINDFPAYGNLSGYRLKTAKGCPVCGEETDGDWLVYCGKFCYMSHRRFLSSNHPLRKKKINGKTEPRHMPVPLSGEELHERVKSINTLFGKPYKPPPDGVCYTKRSLFWDLPYWKDLSVRHCIDVMHVEKNVFDSLVGTLLNMPSKTKDGVKARNDLAARNLRPELHPVEQGNKTYIPPACTTLSRQEKIQLCESLRSIKVPYGYCSNIKRLVSMKDLKLVGLKSHDCHVILQDFLPVAIRNILPKHVRQVITKLCIFFKAIWAKEIDPDGLDVLQADVVMTLCELEMYFPLSFFDMMVHLIVHLVREVKLCGPVHLRNMYGMEREMGTYKRRMKNRYRPEGSIVEATIACEVTGFVADYLANVQPVGLPISRHEGRLQGKGTLGYKLITLSKDVLQQAHLCVLQHMTEVHPYLEEHLSFLKSQNSTRKDAWLKQEHNRTFVKWFTDKVMKELSTEEEVEEEEEDAGPRDTLRWLAYGPRKTIESFEGYDINGFCFYNEDTQITISAEDINKMFELLSLNTPILQIWGRYLYEIAKAYGVHNLAFMCPEKLTSVADSDTENAVDYFEEVLSRCEGRKFILGAYSQENHWMLIVISPETSEVYFMDPQASKRKINFKVHLNLAFRCYCQKGGNHDVRKGTALTWHDTQCQQQEDDFQSAYYVMKFMYDIVLLHHKRQDLKECFAASQLKIGDMINQVRENWSMHFMNSCI